MPFKHEKFVAKVKDENPEHLDADERVQEAVPGQTSTVRTTPIFAIVDTVRRATGKIQSRLIVLTDRNLYLAATGMTNPWRITEVKAKHPRSEAGTRLRELPGGIIELDGERIHFALGSQKHAKELVKAAGGGSEPVE
jgi:hypothetical protein